MRFVKIVKMRITLLEDEGWGLLGGCTADLCTILISVYFNAVELT